MPSLSLQGPPASVCRVCLRLLLRSRTAHSRSIVYARPVPIIITPPPAILPHSYVPSRTLSTRKSPSEITSLEETIIEEPDIKVAYNSLMDTLAKKPVGREGWKKMPDYHLLQSSVTRMLSRIIIDGGKTKGLPTPLEFMRDVQNLEMDAKKYYVHILSAMVSRGTGAKEMLPIFDATVSLVTGTSEFLERNDVERLFSGYEGKILYVIYLYLYDIQATSPVLAAIDGHAAHCNVPSRGQIKESLRLLGSLPPILSHRLVDLFTTLNVRYTIGNSARLKGSLARFSEKNDLSGLQSLYNAAKSLNPSPLDEAAYIRFITGFLSFWRSQKMALQVWEDMVNSGITPSVRAWNALLRYGQTHDSDALLLIWNKMLTVGVMPDVHCWTTRIHAQMQMNQVEDGLMSLQEMIQSGLKPTIQTINAAIDGLLSFGHYMIASKVFSMAGTLEVNPDLTTYNTLLRGMARRGSIDDMMEMLAAMKSRGIQPDVYSFTIIIDGLYKQQGESSVPDLLDVIKILEYMEHLGIPANVVTYTTLVDGLIAEGNFEAVKEVQRIMRNQGVLGNSNFFTVMIRSAFRQGDYDGVEKLWEETTKLNIRRDHVLWTELILGYAQIGATREMEDALEMLKHESGRVVITMKGYVSILRALNRRNEVMAAKKVVESVVEEWGNRREVFNNGDITKMEKQFWVIVGNLGGRGWMKGLREGLLLKRNETHGWANSED